MSPSISILCPTHCHGPLLKQAVRSVLQQTVTDWELFIIGDGVDEATRLVAEEILTWDDRIQWMDRPKSPRHGEPYRHEVLLQMARGDFVFYLADDDLWLPQHLETMLPCLQEHHLCHSLPCRRLPHGEYVGHFALWNHPKTLAWIFQEPRRNSVGLAQVAHRMDFYRTLAIGWRTTPLGEWSDHYMWKQMLSQTAVKATCSMLPTVIQFPNLSRAHLSLEERFAEMQEILNAMQAAPKAFLHELQEHIEQADELRNWTDHERLIQNKLHLDRLREKLTKLETALAHEKAKRTTLEFHLAHAKSKNAKYHGDLEHTKLRVQKLQNRASDFEQKLGKLREESLHQGLQIEENLQRLSFEKQRSERWKKRFTALETQYRSIPGILRSWFRKK